MLVVSVLIVLAMLAKALAPRFLRIPPVVAYMGLGLLLRVANTTWEFMPAPGEWTLDFLGQIGVAALLFQVGLKSDLSGLIRELPRAVKVWAFNVALAGGLSFAVAMSLNLGLVTSLFVGVAFSATSVGISLAVWSDAGRLRSKLGELLLDVAELDDLSAVLLMLAVVAAAPVLGAHGGVADAVQAAFSATGIMLAKVVLFGTACWAFARYLEGPLSRALSRAEAPPDRVLSVAGLGFATAAIAGTIGFSVAVGGLFAGLMFSRDPQTVHSEASFAPIYSLFTPFFFIDVGYAVDTTTIASSAALGALFLGPAVVGKVLGAGLPAARHFGLRNATLLGLSMVPRAEIALLVARTGNRLGDWAVSDEVYGAIVLTSAAGSILAPLVLQKLFERWPAADSIRM